MEPWEVALCAIGTCVAVIVLVGIRLIYKWLKDDDEA